MLFCILSDFERCEQKCNRLLDNDLKLISLINQKILSEVTQPINSESQCITLPLTNVTENRALLQVSGDEIENGTRIINLRPEIAFTLIETKKEFYEAGEEVEFRLLSFDEKLRPIAEKYDAIWIEDSTYFPVFQWTNVQSPSSGILTYKFQLSNDINYGIWRVKTLTKHRQVTEKVFTVSRVSRTEIKIHIEANEFILATDKEAKLNVCVTNVYGYRLKGDLQIIARYRRIPVTQAIEAKLPSYSNTTQIDGCEQIILKASVLFWDSISNEFNLRTIQVNFQFSDHASGYIEARAIDLTVAIQPFRISFPSRKLAKSYFKHHLPYFGFVFIEKPDLSRIANEQITICYELRKVPWIEERNETCREEYSNNDGFIVFEIPPVDRVVSQIFIKASSVNDPDIVSTDVLDPWFTTATSSITMKPLFHESICSREIELEVFISNATQSKQKLFYQILTSSTLHPPKSVQLSLDQWKPQTTPEGEEKQLPIIKKGKLVVELPSSMSVYSTYNRIVVYSVDSNGNLVADSGAFEIDCLQDTDLKISMREEVSKLDVSIGEQASDSLCAFELSHDENRKMLTKLRFLNILKAFEVNQYAPVLDKCQQQKIKNFRQATPSARNQNDLQLNAALLPVIDFHSRWDTFNDIGIQIFANKFFDESPCEWDVFPKGYPDRVLAAFRQSQITIKQQYMKERFDFVRLRKLEAESIHDQIGPQWSLIAASNSSIFKVDKTVFGSAVCAEPTRGIRFVYSKSESERNPIKMIAKLPSNTIIGEEVQIEVYIENIKEGCMPLQVTIQSSQQFNVIRSSPPQCVCSNSIAKFTINPKVFGRINIQVIAKRIQDSSVPKCDHISRAPFSQMVMKESIIVKMPGLHIRDFKTTLHCSQNKKSFSLERSANTRRARVSSDIIDLALNEFKNSRTNPTALDLLSSLAIYSYLTLNTKPEIEQKLQNWLQLEIKKIYQELLTHHFADGSFGPAQARSMGSNFLFTVQAFNVLCNFKQTTLKIVNDYNIRRTLLWIYSRQSSDGCFYPQDASIDSWPLNIQSTFETTAFVLSSLLQTNINNVTLERDRQVLLPPLDAAIQCLKILSDNQKEAHSALANAILAYIESMRGNEVTSKTWLANLTKNEIESNDELYWNGNHQKEIAAFAILTYLKHNEKTEAMKIGRWLLRQPKIFQSPITALAMINVWPFFRSDSQLNLKLRNSRPLVLKDGETHTIPLSPRTELELIGKGCAIIEEEVFDKVTTRSQKYFNISITDTEKGFVTCRKRVMRICMRAIVEERFNFTQVKIQIPSGYKIDQRILSAVSIHHS
ncbi:alpha-2-macroglobiln splicing variant 1 precursor-like protein [Dinothrombium tinctorium]|uniref:Alpha-2-macroglobiln splicing variant 1-like protein n=1 Tax=Dinothrombium tinctorium TaxID=1965070 RepID=A0A3S4QGG1_9ACAR|nr:alpha-2-macroglobiln splicing variant 1 precursor-like protein [Dinothrombium tinctorium]